LSARNILLSILRANPHLVKAKQGFAV